MLPQKWVQYTICSTYMFVKTSATKAVANACVINHKFLQADNADNDTDTADAQ